MPKLLENKGKLPLAFGGAAVSGEGKGYGFGDISEDESCDLIKQAFDLGIKTFDTAPIYGFGLSEKRIGKALKASREDSLIVSKCGVTWDKSKRVDIDNSKEVTKRMLEQSLRDLQSDYIDLYMVHWPDSRCDIRETLEVIAKAKGEGKVKHIGLCNTTPEEFKLASEVEKIEVIQSVYNFFERQEIDKLGETFKSNPDISFMSWGTLDKGILTGRVDRNRKFDKSDARSWAPWWKKMNKEERFLAMDKIMPILKDHGHTGLEFAVSFNLNCPYVSQILCGARTSAQLESLVKAFDNRLSADLLEELEKFAIN